MIPLKSMEEEFTVFVGISSIFRAQDVVMFVDDPG
jgi:hypothetical protein